MDRDLTAAALQEQMAKLPEGWTLYTDPRTIVSESIPVSLRGREFDAIAIGENGGVVFEIVNGRRSLQRKSNSGQLERLRKEVVENPGWRFQLIILPEAPPSLIEASLVNQRIEKASLLKGFDTSGAFILGFSALEWGLVKLGARLGIDYEPNAQKLASNLTQAGELDEDELLRIRSFQKMRNHIVHAVQGPIPADIDVEDLLALAKDIWTRLALD